MELKKSYKGFVLWMIGYVAALLALAIIPAADEGLVMRYIMLVTVWAVAGMAFIIWRTESVYWYNGTTYEEAVAAGRERRKEFARRHLVIFARFALMATAVSCLTLLLGWSEWIDFAFGCTGTVVAACMTIPIKI